MAAEGNNVRRYIYRGEEGQDIPRDGNHIIVIVHESVTVILARAFYGQPNIVEVICHEGVDKIEEQAFSKCRSLRRVIMPGVKIVERFAFDGCTVLTDVECDKLKIIKEYAFNRCKSFRSINLLSIEIVEREAFYCAALRDAKFGSKLRRIEGRAFLNCTSLERIIIPLKDGLITDYDIFMGCTKLKHADLVEGELHETIDALLLDDWRNDMNEQIESINQILPDVFGGFYGTFSHEAGEKADVIESWIRSVLLKIIHYQAEHQRVVNEAGATLHHALPHEIVMNKVRPFLDLPSYTFEVEDHEDEESDSDDEDNMEE